MKIGIKPHTSEELVPNPHTCEKLVPNYHRWEEIVPVKNWNRMQNAAVLGYFTNVKNTHVCHM